MELLCALLTGFSLWLFVYHFFRSRRAWAREELGPLLLDVKAAVRIVRAVRWSRWLGLFCILVAMPLYAVLVYRVMASVSASLFPNLLDLLSYNFELDVGFIVWSSCFFMLALPPYWPTVAAEIRERGILLGNYRLRFWSEINQIRWFLPKTKLESAFWWRRPWPYNRFRVTLNERRVALGQKEAVTAMLARFVLVYDHDGTLLAGPSQAKLMAKTALPVRERARSWLQFNLQSLLLLVVVVSCAASCYGMHYRRLQPQHVAVAQLERFAPAIDYLGIVPWRVDFSKCAKKPADDDLACLESLDQLSDVDLSGSPVTDAGIEHLKGLRYLSYVNCRDTHVTAKGAEELHRILPNATIIYGPAKKRVVLKPSDEN